MFLYCGLVGRALGVKEHCGSCHTDYDEYGMNMFEVEIGGQRVDLCCDVAQALVKRDRVRGKRRG